MPAEVRIGKTSCSRRSNTPACRRHHALSSSPYVPNVNIREVIQTINQMQAEGVIELQKILESKRALRRNLASRPVAEKLRMLDALRERELAIRGRGIHSDSSVLREQPEPCRTKSE